MKNILIGIIIILALASPASAQVVGQGTIPWVVSGAISATVPAITISGTLSSTSCPGTGCVTITLAGQSGVGFRFTDSSFVGSVAAELSMDGGATWGETDLYLTLSSTAYNRLARLTSPGLSGNFAIATAPGTTSVRVRAITYVSGSAAITLSATAPPYSPPSSVGAQDSNVQGIGLIGGRYASISGTMMPAVVTDSPAASNGMGLIVRDPQIAVATGGGANTTGAQIMVKDNTSGVMAPATSLTTAPVGTESAQLVRNIPSGTQSVLLVAGAALAGKFGIDQTTPGTTNKVAIGVDGIVSTKTALTANAPATASVGVASASALASNAGRKGLIIVNVSTATVCFGIAASAAVLNSGICLQPGATWNMNEYSFTTGTINAIASGAASTISIQEFQ